MSLSFRFAIISDPHIALPQTIWDHPTRFHLVELSIAALESVLTQLHPLDLDFVLIPGDLTQHGEPENHAWLSDRLAQLPYPVYVVPGNHDVPSRDQTAQTIGLSQFPLYYQKFGYQQPQSLYYTCTPLPGVRLIGLNSNDFDAEGQQIPTGRLDPAQLAWLQSTLASVEDEVVLVMVHHNVIEHIPGQTHHAMGRRYMLDNAPELLKILHAAGVQLIFTGHLHVQDIAHRHGIYEITTGSLVSYPHPYRVLHFHQTDQGDRHLHIQSGRVESVPGWADLQTASREWMGDRSFNFMMKFLTHPPLNLSEAEAEALAPHLRYFWADIAGGDAHFDFPDLPLPIRHHLQQFGAIDAAGNAQCIDNQTVLCLNLVQH